MSGEPESASSGGDGVSIDFEAPRPALRREIVDGIKAFTRSVIGQVEAAPLVLTLRREASAGIAPPIGGLLGETHMGWLFVEALWIAPDWRGRGYGRRLLAAAEAEGRRRGVRGAYLNTFSFQAPDFYFKLGYRQVGRLDDCPAGHHRLYLAKDWSKATA